MRILLITNGFPPDVGGIEAMSQLLANGFVQAGHEVTVITRSSQSIPGEQLNSHLKVLKRPGLRRQLLEHRKADVVLHNNICLKLYWPLLMVSRPVVIAIRTWLTRPDGRVSWRDRLKLRVIGRADGCIAVSMAIASSLPFSTATIPNGFRDDIFYSDDTIRDLDLLFVGRLVHDKGCDLFLRVLALSRRDGICLKAAIVGDGPELENLRMLARELKLTDTEVAFLGALGPSQVADVMRRSHLLVLPSRWQEPFGIVALEGMACGAIPVVTAGGGWVEPVTGAGAIVPRDDLAELRMAIAGLLQDEQQMDELRMTGFSRAEDYSAQNMVERYSQILLRARGEIT